MRNRSDRSLRDLWTLALFGLVSSLGCYSMDDDPLDRRDPTTGTQSSTDDTSTTPAVDTTTETASTAPGSDTAGHSTADTQSPDTDTRPPCTYQCVEPYNCVGERWSNIYDDMACPAGLVCCSAFKGLSTGRSPWKCLICGNE